MMKKIREIGYAIFGRRGRRLGLLGLGASTLLTPARVMGGITLTAAGIWAVVNLHPDSGGADRSAGHGRPAAHHSKLPHHTQGRDGVVDLSASGGKLFLAMNRTASDRGKGADQTHGQPASGAPATHSGFLAAGSWSSAFGHHATGAPASHSNISPPPSSSSPGSPKLKESPQVGSGPGAGSPHAPGHPKEFGPNGTPTDASVHQPGSTGDPVAPPGNPASPGSNSGTNEGSKTSHNDPGVVLDDSGAPHDNSGTPHDDSNSSNDDSGELGSVPGDPGGQGGLPGGDLGDMRREDPGMLSLPDTFAPPLLVATDLPLGPGSDGDAAAPSGIAAVSVPEPSSTALLGIGLLGLGWARRRYQAAAESGF